ncbi:hypothetical protein [Celeribacter litoreus]|uniref:hypothetical protein n=1 Tax=Celeribacter litoreus TaxID=2876714 RepID=UPI001CC9B43E|nr:hypothetical protein [Celeribacter litoreus]MCA0044058.1 hypothetical protein [Celeribacter litoreus]
MMKKQRILILGSSHTGAFQAARHRIAQAFPSLDVHYFGLPGSAYFHATFENGIFRAPEKRQRQFDWMDSREIDVRQFDRALFVGQRFAFGSAMRLIMSYDILEEVTRSKRPLMSEAAMSGLLEALIAQQVEGLITKFGRDPRFSFLAAPYPLDRSTLKGPAQEKALKAVLRKETGVTWGLKYEEIIAAEMAAARLDLVPQPLETRETFLTTQDHFSRQPSSAGVPDDEVDNRHMNADYGWQVFCAYAETKLEIRPLPIAEAEEHETGLS